MIGVVVSNKMDKTAVVAVERTMQHPLYKKIVRRTKRYKAHDEANAASLGDVVRIMEMRPMSKEKRWRIAETLVKGNVAEIAPREIGVPEELLAPVVAETEQAPEAIEPAAPEGVEPLATDAGPEPTEADTATEETPYAEPGSRS